MKLEFGCYVTSIL